MNIELLNSSYVEDAAKLVFDNYLEERKSVNILPLHNNYLDLLSKYGSRSNGAFRIFKH